MKRLAKSTLFVKQLADLAISNPKVLNKIDRVIKNILKECLLRFNKGEKLKHYPNRYSCRIDKCNRLVYEKYKDTIILLSCKGHYEDK